MDIKNYVKKLIMQIINPPKQFQRNYGMRVIKVQNQDITLVSCSNVVLKINTPDAAGYFTECRSHLPRKQYVYKLVNDYFDLMCDDKSGRQDKEVVLSSISDDCRFRKLISSCLNKASAGKDYAGFLKNNDGNLIGICTQHADEQQKQRIRSFVVRYLRPHLIQHDSHKFMRYRYYHTRPTNKVLATEAVADLIGANELIPHAEYVKLEVNGLSDRALFGIFMEDARGICAMDIPPEVRRQKLTGKLQRSLIRLNLLDVICHDMDHSPNNYNVYTGDDEMLEGVHAFDNNDASTFSLRTSINFTTYKNCARIASDDGIILRPAVDIEIADKIMSLRKRAFYRSVFPYIGLLQAESAWQRIRKLQQSIVLTKKIRPEIFLEAHLFGEDTLNRELNGEYQKTYLVSFLEDCKYRY